jgi:hypothetical protein
MRRIPVLLIFFSAILAAQYAPSRDRQLFNQVRADLDRAAGYPYASRDDRKRFDEARRDLFDFEARFDQGRYEKRELDRAIDRVQKVASHNSLDARERGALEEDLRRMRDYRAYRENHVYRDYGYR